MQIRLEQPEDVAAIAAVNRAAFETGSEADLVDRLRERANPFISLVADNAGSIVGHILFTPVTLSGHANLRLLGLAPMAVLPSAQRRGIGSALVRAGLERCRKEGAAAVVVLGHPAYYPRFGFSAASRFGIRPEYNVPDEVFMALELDAGSLRSRTGTIRYHDAFASA
jgi:putative acetyltransferase